eukprot:scaffold1415_cov117-Isochrysis_galbana.AAC.17
MVDGRGLAVCDKWANKIPLRHKIKHITHTSHHQGMSHRRGTTSSYRPPIIRCSGPPTSYSGAENTEELSTLDGLPSRKAIDCLLKKLFRDNRGAIVLPDSSSSILAFLATGQHGAAELRVGPDGRLPSRAAVTKAAARRRAARGAPNGTTPGLAVAGQQRHHRHTLCCGLPETAQRNRGAGVARFTSQNHITNCSAEQCRTPLSHYGAERACVPQEPAATMPKAQSHKSDFEP